MTKEIILFDTEDYNSEDYYTGDEMIEDYYTGDEMIEEVQYILDEYTNKPRGEVYQWVLLSTRSSRYGSISNHGQTGYKDLRITNLAEALLTASENADRIVIKEDQGELQVDYYDHDGTHHCKVKSVSKSKGNYYSSVVEYESFENKLRFIKKLPTLKTKKSAINQLKK